MYWLERVVNFAFGVLGTLNPTFTGCARNCFSGIGRPANRIGQRSKTTHDGDDDEYDIHSDGARDGHVYDSFREGGNSGEAGDGNPSKLVVAAATTSKDTRGDVRHLDVEQKQYLRALR